MHAPPAGGADDALRRAELQALAFAPAPGPGRADLAAAPPVRGTRPLRVRVHRNHGFELAVPPLEWFLGYAGYAPEAWIGGYDDSLAFGELAGEADVEVVWVDPARYASRLAPAEVSALVGARVAALRERSAAPILVPVLDDPAWDLPALEGAIGRVAGAHPLPLAALQQALGPRFLDPRAAALTGTRLSGPALVQVARLLAFRWIPASVTAGIKAIALDLDQTLYRGVLGEDGVQGVELTPAHAALQRDLVALQERGILLAVASRNEAEDARALLATREDFPLRAAHLSASAVSWGPKAQGLAEVARQLRIAPDAILFVDDNPGELAAVASELPGIRTLYASADAEATRRALALWPGLFRWAVDETDRLRSADLRASEERAALAARAADPGDYLRALGAALTFAVNPARDARRLYEMSHKTNQFNLALARLPEAEVARRVAGREGGAVSVRLRDRLSDSGVVASVLARRDHDGGGEVLVVDELCISCRALGRQLEDLMVGGAVRLLLGQHPARRVRFVHATGPRNAPAREWLARFAGVAALGAEGALELPAERFAGYGPDGGHPVTIEVAHG
ncbi:MAG TPA: HAD-IIIC family phosphatase [Gemmatimonadaceae bacterium]